MKTLRASLKLTATVLMTSMLVPVQMLVMRVTKGSGAYFVPQLWHKIILKIFDIKVRSFGKPITDRQVFFVGNHLSHLDIPVLGSQMRASFIAKEEIAHWPVFGTLARLNQSAFISRSSGKAGKVRNNIQDMINAGKNIILFPEGTSTRGETVLDFKSSLFSIPLKFADRGLLIQPFTLEIEKVDEKPANTKELLDLYAWDRDNDIEIGPHIWNFLQIRGAQLRLTFHDAIVISPDEDRKDLAKRVHKIVASPFESPARDKVLEEI